MGDEVRPGPTPDRRRRRGNVEGGRRAQHQVKVSAEEEAALLLMASKQGVSIPRLLVESALSSDAGETRSQRMDALRELFALHRLLGTIANNVNQIAKATNATNEEQPDLFHTLGSVRRACARIDDVVDELSLT